MGCGAAKGGAAAEDSHDSQKSQQYAPERSPQRIDVHPSSQPRSDSLASSGSAVAVLRLNSTAEPPAPRRRAEIMVTSPSTAPVAPAGGPDDIAALSAEMAKEFAEVKAALRGVQSKLTPGESLPERPRCWRVVVTGGPCAGKSSSMAKLRSMLEEQGLGVFVAPEAATILLGNGGDVIFRISERVRDAALVAFQKAIMRIQMELEDSFLRLAKATDKPSVVICDRGTLDGKAYATPEMWAKLLAEAGLTEMDLLGRYDAVVHMVTAADGAEAFYSDETNATRTETVEQAKDLCMRLRGCYLGHPQMHIIDNSTGFTEKVERACEPILQLVGRKRAVGPRQKFLLPKSVDASAIPDTTVTAVCTFVYLLGSTVNNLRRIRIREFGGTRQYSFQQVIAQGRRSRVGSVVSDDQGPRCSHSQAGEGDQRVMKERPLTEIEYDHLRMQADHACPLVRREHLFFTHGPNYFDCATFTDPPEKRGTTVLSVEAGRTKDGHGGFFTAADVPTFLTDGAPLHPEASKPSLSDILGFSPGYFRDAPRGSVAHLGRAPDGESFVAFSNHAHIPGEGSDPGTLRTPSNQGPPGLRSPAVAHLGGPRQISASTGC